MEAWWNPVDGIGGQAEEQHPDIIGAVKTADGWGGIVGGLVESGGRDRRTGRRATP